nr:hypothetical protein [uncultured Dethiosulfovibrio sp.]
MRAFSFTLSMTLWGYIIAVLYARFVIPFVEGIRESLVKGELVGEMAGGARSNRALKVVVDLVLFMAQAYFLTGWSAYTIVKIRSITHLPEVTSPIIFYLIGMGVCQWALAYIALRERFQGFLSILHSVVAMGACATFALKPQHIPVLYGWMVNIMGGLR